MLVTSIFSFSHNVLERLLLQGGYKSGLCGKELSILVLKPSFIWENAKGFYDIKDGIALHALCNVPVELGGTVDGGCDGADDGVMVGGGGRGGGSCLARIIKQSR